MASVQPSEIPAYQQPFSQVLTALGADARRGLTDGEARVRLGEHGRNELTADTYPRNPVCAIHCSWNPVADVAIRLNRPCACTEFRRSAERLIAGRD
jgi:hypothetical protein